MQVTRRKDAFVLLAEHELWSEVYAMIDGGVACVDDYSEGGFTVLHFAAVHGAVAAIDELVQRGANIRAATINCGAAPLHMAALNNQSVAATRLVHHGAEPNAKTTCGRTPIDDARRFGHIELAAWLKTARALRHWAQARAFGRPSTGALACAWFWYAHVGARLCAPGGKWAERDRAAFEKDFLDGQEGHRIWI